MTDYFLGIGTGILLILVNIVLFYFTLGSAEKPFKVKLFSKNAKIVDMADPLDSLNLDDL